jgi:hypothetical protein
LLNIVLIKADDLSFGNHDLCRAEALDAGVKIAFDIRQLEDLGRLRADNECEYGCD